MSCEMIPLSRHIFVLTCALTSISASADNPASTLGIVSEQPADGVSVRVGDAFLVPYTETIPGTDITFEMVPIPAGTYLMGSPDAEPDRKDDEGPQVKVNVDAMWVAKWEVRWDAYMEFMGLYEVFVEFQGERIRTVTDDNRVDAITAPTPLYKPVHTFEYGDDPDQPAVTMTQYAAQQFTKWLGAITGRQYRLPTEAEWEYACRAGATTAYSWGDDPDQAEDHAWYFDNADDGQVPGGSKKPNAFGLFDMHGNVGEWTMNAYTEDGYEWLVEKQPVDAIAAVRWPETATSCVVRGGTWQSDPQDLRCAARMVSDDEAWKDKDPTFPRSPWWFSDDPARGVGFRLFRSYRPLEPATIQKFWDHAAEDAKRDIRSRLSGNGILGLVDKALPEAMKDYR